MKIKDLLRLERRKLKLKEQGNWSIPFNPAFNQAAPGSMQTQGPNAQMPNPAQAASAARTAQSAPQPIQQQQQYAPPYQYGAGSERSLDPTGVITPQATPGAVPLLPQGVGMHGNMSPEQMAQMTQMDPAAQQAAAKARRTQQVTQMLAPGSVDYVPVAQGEETPPPVQMPRQMPQAPVPTAVNNPRLRQSHKNIRGLVLHEVKKIIGDKNV